MKTVKMIASLLLVAMLLTAFAACGTKTPDTPTVTDAPQNTEAPAATNPPADTTDAPEETQAPDPEAFSIKVNDTMTITDPEGLEFDERIVLYGDMNNPTVQSYLAMGITVNEQYVVLYGKDGKVVGEYTYIVFGDEASAETMKSMMPTMTVEGVNGINVNSADMIEATIAQMQAAGMMSGESVEDYASMYETVYLYTRWEA